VIVLEKNKDTMKIKKKKDRVVKNRFLEWILYIICYAIVLILTSVIFSRSFYISNEYYGLYALIAAIIIYLLNQTIKPLLFYLTLPLIGVTLGLFYPLINVLILYLTSFMLGSNFVISNFLIAIVIALFVSFMNILMEGIIIKPIVNRRNKDE